MGNAAFASVAIGCFDGVHLAHLEVLRGVEKVITFRNHPLTVLAPAQAPWPIMGVEERVAALRTAGVQAVEVLDFTPELAAMTPAAFLASVGVSRRTKIRCGANWHFGAGGAGDDEWLRAHGYSVEVVPAVEIEGAPVSSSRIRRALAGGEIAAAAAMLGRFVRLTGERFAGKGEGKELGFPTVNLHVRGTLKLPLGVYEVEVAGMRALANYGVAPTFGARAWPEPVLELYFPGGEPKIAKEGWTAGVRLVRFLRPERQFASPAELQAQIAVDCQALKQAQSNFFKAYDMRGRFGEAFDLELVERVGQALPQVVPGSRWLVGRDCRVTGAAVRDALVRGLTAAGAEVTDLGLCTTPMVYFFTAQGGYDGSVMVTASHNPPADNGLKVSRRTALPVGYATGLAEVERLARAQRTLTPGSPAAAPQVTAGPGIAPYLAWMRDHTDLAALQGLNFAVDCSNGMASLFAAELFPQAVVLNDRLDGRFSAHSPNPLKAEAREQLAAVVRERGLDCGVIFDGDADRAMFVDEKGDFIQPDYLIPLVARATLRHGVRTGDAPESRPQVLHDVRTSRGAVEAIRALGCEPVMVPVGHAFAKPKMRETGALCGGELAGHYYFGEFFGCDSGLLAALRILEEVAAAKREHCSFSARMAPIAGKYANSGELNFEMPDQAAAIQAVLAAAKSELPPEIGRSEIDGVRLEYAQGWVSVRKSNTEPYLRLIIEADTDELLKKWVAALRPQGKI